jgi:hypothetical protein
MPVPATNISVSSILTEVGSSNIQTALKGNLYALSDSIGNSDSGNYHNYNGMGASALLSFNEAIALPYIGLSADPSLGRWAGYTHNSEFCLSWVIDNPTSGFVNINFFAAQNEFSFNTLIRSITVPAFGNNMEDPFVTNFGAKSGIYDVWGPNYWITAEINVQDPSRTQFMQVISAVDSDGIGGGQNRSSYTQYNGSWDFNNGAFASYLVAGDDPTLGIPWNKRTTFNLLFT